MRVVGLDVGKVRVGVAVSDELLLTAQGLETIKRKNLKEDLRRLKELFTTLNAERVVVGLPKNMNGTLGPQAQEVLRFVDEMKRAIPLPITLWDERLTTVAAERALLQADLPRARRKRLKDKLAAVLILQNYLDSQR